MKSKKYIPFYNNKGQKMKMKSSMTLSELSKLGIDKISLKPEGAPLPNNWWTTEKPKV